MEAVILAGGFGTRLKNVVKDLPKPMAPVNGKPFLSYILDYLLTQGVSKVVLSVGYKHEVISEYFGSTYKGLQVEYSVETEPLGTGGAIKKAFELCSSTNVFVMNGDTYFPIDFAKVNEFQSNLKSAMVVALKNVPNSDRYGSVLLSSENKITGFAEKSASANTVINGGIYLVNKNLFTDLNITQSTFSFEKEILEKLYTDNDFHGLLFDDYFIDIGIPEDFERAQKELSI